jgi:predicted tellurium resistance membrane protein TerC
VGAALLAKFHWLLYLFGAFLLLTGIKMWFAAGKEPDLDKNPVLRWITRPPAVDQRRLPRRRAECAASTRQAPSLHAAVRGAGDDRV